MPAGDLHWLVPFAAGGGFDVYSRLIEPHLQRELGVEVVVENLTGGGGTICALKLKSSAPNGLTLGIMNAPGLLVASMSGSTPAPNPAEFSILGRVKVNRVVIAAAGESKFKALDDVLNESRKRPIVFGISEAGSTSFFNCVVASHLVGIKPRYLSGFTGSLGTEMAVMRGEADLLSGTFDSLLDHIENGDLIPILQTGSEPIAQHSSLTGVPLLGGESGMAAKRAMELGRDPQEAIQDAAALADVLGAGIVVAGPPDLEKSLFECLEETVQRVLHSADFKEAARVARRSLDVARGAEARQILESASINANRFVGIVSGAIKQLRE